MTEISPSPLLRRRMIGDLTVRNLSPATPRSNVHANGFSAARRSGWGQEEARISQAHLVAGVMELRNCLCRYLPCRTQRPFENTGVERRRELLRP